MSKSVGLRALQQNAAAVVGEVTRGAAVEITDRGRPVAQIVPLTDTRVAMLVATGRARPPRQRIADLPAALPARRGKPSLGTLLARSRAQER